MWETIWGALSFGAAWLSENVVALAIGAIVGALLSTYFTLRAKRPKLSISGPGSGGGPIGRQSIHVTNQPSFWGLIFEGETAKITAHIQRADKTSQAELLFWQTDGLEKAENVMLQPGQRAALNLFYWHKEGTEGYYIADRKDEPIVPFRNRKLKFIITLNDSLQRKTEFKFDFEFDDSNLKQAPRVKIILPLTLRHRANALAGALRNLRSAFRLQR